MSFLLLLLIIDLISEVFLAGIDIGYFSLRVYLTAGLLIVTFLQKAFSHTGYFCCKEARLLFLSYFLFILWAIFNKFYNGEGSANVFYNIASSHGMAISNFLIAQAILTTPRRITLFAGTMALTAATTGFVAIMQWLGVGWFWNLALKLHPYQEDLLLGLDHGGSRGNVPGLNLYSIDLSYHLITFGAFFLASALYLSLKRYSIINNTSRFVGLMVIILSLLVCQSRSALFGSFIAFTVITLYKRVKFSDHGYYQYGLSRLVIIVMIVFMLFLYSFKYLSQMGTFSAKAGEGGYELERVLKLEDRGRAWLYSATLKFYLQGNLIIGEGTEKLNKYLGIPNIPSARKIAPHNMFLNCLVYYGLIGLCLMFPIIWYTYRTCVKALSLAGHIPLAEWIVGGAVMGILGYVIHAQLHNNSFTTGGTWPWWLLGLLCGVIAQNRTAQKVEKPSV